MDPQQYPQQPGQPQVYTPQPQSGPYPQQPGAPVQSVPGQQPYQYGSDPSLQAGQANGQQYGQQPVGRPQIIAPPQLNPTLGYSPYPYPNDYDQPARKGPNKFIIAVIILSAVALVAVGLIALMSGGNNTGNTTGTQTTNTTTTTTTDQSGNDTLARDDGTLDLRSKITLSKNLKAQTIKGTMKQQVNLSSGFSFMVNKLEAYTSPNTSTVPTAGKMFIVATVVVGNRNDSGNISVSYTDFRLRDESNQVTAASGVTNEILSNTLSTPSEIKTGQQITGKVVFEVPSTSTSWVLLHTETYQKNTDNTTFNVEGDIVMTTATSTTTPTSTTSGTTGTSQTSTNSTKTQ